MPRAILVPLLLLLAAPAWAAEPPTLRIDGKDTALPQGLQRGADDRVWIVADDLRDALGVLVKPLIPKPPTGRRPDRRREREGWILCSRDTCGLYRGETQGSVLAPSFELAKVAKLLGYRHRVRGAVHELQRPARGVDGTPDRAQVGRLVPDLALPVLGGGTLSLRNTRGERLLIVTWASWSETRERLDVWRQVAQTRASQGLRLVLVALEAEGEEQVGRYVTTTEGATVAIDAHAEFARHFPMKDAGRWFYVDELGILRAEGTRPDADALAWIDLHLAEAPTPRKAEARPAPPAPDLTVLRERAAAEPTRVEPALALLAALGEDGTEERLGIARGLVERHPKQAPLAFRLAAMLIAANRRDEAVSVLEAARRRTPQAWYLRRQYWALWQPNRYYMGKIDAKWEQEQRRTEEKAFGRPGR